MNKRILVSICYIILGVSLILAGVLERVDSFWSGMGATLLLMGILRLVRGIRYRRDETYRETCDTERRDERNRFLSNRAWAWAGYCYVLIAALATIGFKLAGKEALMMLASGSVCLMVLLYWVFFLVLRRKY